MSSKYKTLTEDEMKIVKGSIETVWNAIAPDVLEADEFNIRHKLNKRRMDNLDAIEACIDADRLETFDEEDGEQAHALIRALYDSRDYAGTLRYLAKHININ